MKVGPAWPQRTTDIATHQHVTNDRIAIIRKHRDRARRVPRSVEDRGCDPKLVEPLALRRRQVDADGLKGNVTHEVRRYAPTHANALEPAVVALLGKNAVVGVIGNGAFRGRSQIDRIAAMVGMNVRVKDEFQIAYVDAQSSASCLDPLASPRDPVSIRTGRRSPVSK